MSGLAPLLDELRPLPGAEGLFDALRALRSTLAQGFGALEPAPAPIITAAAALICPEEIADATDCLTVRVAAAESMAALCGDLEATVALACLRDDLLVLPPADPCPALLVNAVAAWARHAAKISLGDGGLPALAAQVEQVSTVREAAVLAAVAAVQAEQAEHYDSRAVRVAADAAGVPLAGARLPRRVEVRPSRQARQGRRRDPADRDVPPEGGHQGRLRGDLPDARPHAGVGDQMAGRQPETYAGYLDQVHSICQRRNPRVARALCVEFMVQLTKIPARRGKQ